MKIRAIVLDGFHQGHCVVMEYYPTLKLLRPETIRVDYCCDGEEYPLDDVGEVEYKECFRGVDQKVVLYSTTGKSDDVFSWFAHKVSLLPWTKETTLKFGYHNEPVIREDSQPPSQRR